jgi:hypothetical protein
MGKKARLHRRQHLEREQQNKTRAGIQNSEKNSKNEEPEETNSSKGVDDSKPSDSDEQGEFFWEGKSGGRNLYFFFFESHFAEEVENTEGNKNESKQNGHGSGCSHLDTIRSQQVKKAC